jgi:hypothetical protein
MILGEPKHRLWSAPVAALAFTAMQWILPRCQFRSDNYFSPVNIALFVMLLKLVAAPALLMTVGPESPVLSALPSISSMEGALLIDTMAYVALCLGLASGRSHGAPSTGFQLPPPNAAFILFFAALGLLGFIAEFGSIGRIVAYFTEPSAVSELQQQADGSWMGLLGTFLRPFLAFSLVAWWTGLADRRQPVWIVTLAGLAAAALIAIANMTFNFNRAAFMFPLLTMAAVYHLRIRKIPFGWTLGAAMAALPLLLLVSTYRTNLMAGARTDPEDAFRSLGASMADNVQAYAVGPQYTGLFYDRIGWGEQLYGGSTLVASAMSPVPVLGKGFRAGAGPALFNRAIYGIAGIEDQILPFNAELFANFHLPGVIVGFAGLGFLLSKAERWIASAGSGFAAFSAQYAALWGALLAAWSVSIYSQILIYFFGPVYLYVFAIHLRESLRTPAPRWSVAR